MYNNSEIFEDLFDNDSEEEWSSLITETVSISLPIYKCLNTDIKAVSLSEYCATVDFIVCNDPDNQMMNTLTKNFISEIKLKIGKCSSAYFHADDLRLCKTVKKNIFAKESHSFRFFIVDNCLTHLAYKNTKISLSFYINDIFAGNSIFYISQNGIAIPNKGCEDNEYDCKDVIKNKYVITDDYVSKKGYMVPFTKKDSGLIDYSVAIPKKKSLVVKKGSKTRFFSYCGEIDKGIKKKYENHSEPLSFKHKRTTITKLPPPMLLSDE